VAIEKPQEILNVRTVERTWRVEFFCDHGIDYRAVFHRELLRLLEDGTVLSREELAPVVRFLSRVKGNPEAMKMMGAVKALGDAWAQEDADARA
jgi:hypothetical protein